MKQDVRGIFKERFRKWVDQAGLTHDSIAKRCFIDRQNVTRYYNGTLPKPEHLQRICKHLNISADYLLGLNEVEQYDTDLQNASAYLGFSPEMIQNLVRISSTGDDCAWITRKLISAEHFPHLIVAILNAVKAEGDPSTPLSDINYFAWLTNGELQAIINEIRKDRGELPPERMY